MTEDEAKAKTCWRTLAPTVAPYNSRVEINPRPCLGSACMAWVKIPSFAECSTLEAYGISLDEWASAVANQSPSADLLAAIEHAQADGWLPADSSTISGMSWRIGRGEGSDGDCGLKQPRRHA